MSCNGSNRIDDYAEDGGPEEVLLLCTFYHDALWS